MFWSVSSGKAKKYLKVCVTSRLSDSSGRAGHASLSRVTASLRLPKELPLQCSKSQDGQLFPLLYSIWVAGGGYPINAKSYTNGQPFPDDAVTREKLRNGAHVWLAGLPFPATLPESGRRVQLAGSGVGPGRAAGSWSGRGSGKERWGGRGLSADTWQAARHCSRLRKLFSLPCNNINK